MGEDECYSVCMTQANKETKTTRNIYMITLNGLQTTFGNANQCSSFDLPIRKVLHKGQL